MGSLSSVGMSDNTIQSLATALGYLGSGNLSALNGNNMQNLLVMAAAQQGQSYADLLTRGLDAESVNTLMQGVIKYIANIGANESNVVRSEYARIFGLNVSDIVAARQVGNVTENGVISTDISNFLTSVKGYISSSSKINNSIENFITN